MSDLPDDRTVGRAAGGEGRAGGVGAGVPPPSRDPRRDRRRRLAVGPRRRDAAAVRHRLRGRHLPRLRPRPGGARGPAALGAGRRDDPAFYGPRDHEGLHFLRRARSIHPSAKRVVVAEWGNFESRWPVFRAIGEGHVENLLLRPERPRDEEFHGGVVDLLEDWHWAQGTGGFEAVRVIGHHDERTHLLRDMFARNHIPVGFYEADEESGRRILRGLGLEEPELPVLDLRFTSPPRALAEPERHRPRRGLRAHHPARPGRRLGHGDHRRRARGPRGGGVRGLRGLVDARRRAGGDRGPGRHELAHPQLPGVRARHQRQPPRLPLVPPGLDARGRVPLLPLGRPASRWTTTSSACCSPTARRRAARTTIVATGVDYRRLDIPEVEELIGRGVFYGACGHARPRR